MLPETKLFQELDVKFSEWKINLISFYLSSWRQIVHMEDTSSSKILIHGLWCHASNRVVPGALSFDEQELFYYIKIQE